MNTRITILDYGIGNVKSIQNALERMNVDIQLSNDKKIIMNSDGIVLPGVGAFSHGMANLNQCDLPEVIYDFVKTGKPLLGICLGMQMLLSESEEFGQTKGLDLIPGKVVKMPIKHSSADKLPHVSWNELKKTLNRDWNGTILEGIENGADMYFVHSFVAQTDKTEHILSTTEYAGYEFTSSIQMDNVFGCQFHPEKSAEKGLKILENFVKIAKEDRSV